MSDSREDYNDQFTGSNWAHYLIRRVDPSKDGDTNLAVLLDSKIKITPLKAVVNFLKTNFAIKYPDFVEPLNTGKPTKTKTELANQIIDFVKKTVPHLCKTCDTNYTPYIDNRSDGEDPAVTCFLCEVPAHAVCIKRNSINHNQGIVYLCATCYISKGKSEAIITDKTGLPQQDPTGEEDSDSDESEITPYQKPPVVEKSSRVEKLIKTKKLTKKRHSKSNQQIAHQSETDEDETSSESEEPSNLCPEYKWGKCHQFNTCPYDHPPRCWSWLQHGKCPYKRKCRYNHPPLCRYSRRERQCYNVECKFFHLYGTKRNQDEQQSSDRRRMNSGSENQRRQTRAQERSAQDNNSNQRQSAPSSNNRNPDVDSKCSPEMAFLVNMIKELKEELKKDISDIKKDMNNVIQEQENQSTPNVAPQSHVQPDQTSQQYYPESTYNYNPYAPQYPQMYQRWYYK